MFTAAKTMAGAINTIFFTLSGAFFGSAAGYALMKARAPFSAGGLWWQRLLRYLAGLVGMFVILYGLDPLFTLFAPDESVLGYILRYIRYGTATFWVLFGAPWVFLKVRLAEAI